MDKAKLKRYPKTIRDIAILEKEIHDMETTDAGMGSDTVLDYRSGAGVPHTEYGFMWPVYEQRKAQLEQLRQEEAEVREFVESIQDPLTRWVFQMRVYQDKSWLQIAMAIGKTDDSYPRKCIYENFLKKS